MKHYTTLLLAAMLSVFTFSSQAQTSTTEYHYTIHIGAFVKAQLTDFDDVRRLGYVYPAHWPRGQYVAGVSPGRGSGSAGGTRQ